MCRAFLVLFFLGTLLAEPDILYHMNCSDLMHNRGAYVMQKLGADPEVLIDNVFRCIGVKKSSRKDNTGCCLKANISDPCLAACNPENFDTSIARLIFIHEFHCPDHILVPAFAGRKCVPSTNRLKTRPMLFGIPIGVIIAGVKQAGAIALNVAISVVGNIMNGGGGGQAQQPQPQQPPPPQQQQ